MKPWVIVGAGCAGLSLAVHRLRVNANARIVLVDPRESYDDDRTWCAFRCDSHPFTSLVSQRWSQVRVRAGNREAVARLQEHPYEMIASADFYRAALDEVRQARHVRIVRAKATQVFAGVVHTEGDSIEAAHVFDGRPMEAVEACEGGMAQCFSGVVVRSPEPRFDPHIADLMDFDMDVKDHVRFRYVLPFDACTALVEDTVFSRRILSVAEPALEGALRGCKIIRREQGVLPMTSRVTPDGVPGVTSIGLRAGVAKASSGYAFDFIQRHCALLAHNPHASVPRALRHRWLDEVFLAELMTNPAQGAEYFMRMFEAANHEPRHADRIARFMMEASSLDDERRVMATLPWAPFAMRALGSPRRWMRARKRAQRAMS